MTFDAKTTAALYRVLTDVVGEDHANRLVPQLAALVEDRFVTKDFLRAELAELRVELGLGPRPTSSWGEGHVPGDARRFRSARTRC